MRENMCTQLLVPWDYCIIHLLGHEMLLTEPLCYAFVSRACMECPLSGSFKTEIIKLVDISPD